MSFQSGESGNPSGRPKGARTKLVPLATFRQSLKAVAERAKVGDPEAQNLVVQAALVHREWAGLDANKAAG